MTIASKEKALASDILKTLNADGSLKNFVVHATNLNADVYAAAAPPVVSLAPAAAGASVLLARGDHRHALSQDIVPTWTGLHTFDAGATIAAGQNLNFGADVLLKRKGANVLQPGSGDCLESEAYQSGVSGWHIDDQLAEFANVLVRGELRSAVFVKGLVEAHAGTFAVAKSSGKTTADMTPTNPTPWTMTVGDPPGGGFLFDNSDICEVKSEYASGIADVWFTVSARVDNGDGTQSYTCTYAYGTTDVAIPRGAAVLDWGVSGGGAVTLSADGTIGAVPNLSIITHAGAPWTAKTLQARLGNLNGSYGYADNTYGVALGTYAAGKTSITIDPTNGLRIINGTGTVIGQWQADGDLLLGTNIAAPATTNLVIFNAAQTYNAQAVEAGDLLLGDNSAAKANLFWDKSAGKLQFRGGTTMQCEIGTSGALLAGGGNTVLDSNGVKVIASTTRQWNRSYGFSDAGAEMAGLYAYADAGSRTLDLGLWQATGKAGTITINSWSPTGQPAKAEMYAKCASGPLAIVRAISSSGAAAVHLYGDVSVVVSGGGDGNLDVAGNVKYTGSLQANRNGAYRTGSIFVPITKYIVLGAVVRSGSGTETITLDNTRIPASAKAVSILLSVFCNTAGDSTWYFIGSASAGNDQYLLGQRVIVLNINNHCGGVCACGTNGTNALLYGTYSVPGGFTMTVGLQILGYFV